MSLLSRWRALRLKLEAAVVSHNTPSSMIRYSAEISAPEGARMQRALGQLKNVALEKASLDAVSCSAAINAREKAAAAAARKPWRHQPTAAA